MCFDKNRTIPDDFHLVEEKVALGVARLFTLHCRPTIGALSHAIRVKVACAGAVNNVLCDNHALSWHFASQYATIR